MKVSSPHMVVNFRLVRIIIYGVIAFFSLFLIIPLADLKERFTDQSSSKCLLYSDVRYERDTTAKTLFFKIRFGQQDVCTYNLTVAILFGLLYPLGAGGVYLFLYLRHKSAQGGSKSDMGVSKSDIGVSKVRTGAQKAEKWNISSVALCLHTVLELIVCVLVFVSAGMISAGFRYLCQSFTSGSNSIQRCQDAQRFADWAGYDASNFYTSLSVATAGSWFLLVSWLCQNLVSAWKIWKLDLLPSGVLVTLRG